jgi:hypothetical protein
MSYSSPILFIIPCLSQTHVFKHSDFPYAIELINSIITFNFTINSLFHFPVGYLFEGRGAANSYHFHYYVFYRLTSFTLSPLLSSSSLPHIRVLPATIIVFPPRIHVPAISILVTPHFVVKFAPIYGTISLKLLT